MLYRQIYKPSFLKYFDKKVDQIELEDNTYKINLLEIVKVMGYKLKKAEDDNFIFNINKKTIDSSVIYIVEDDSKNRAFIAYQIALKLLPNKRMKDEYGNWKDSFYMRIFDFINELLAPKKLFKKLTTDYPNITTEEIAEKMDISYTRAYNIRRGIY